VSEPINFAANPDEELVWQVPLGSLKPWSLFKNTVWDGITRPITRVEVRKALQNGNLLSPTVVYDPLRPETLPGNLSIRQFHIRRIAYLVTTSYVIDPIEIDVGVPDLGCNPEWIITDGNHRLAAAFYRKDEFVPVSVSGDLEYAEELLKPRGKCPEKG